MTRLNATALIRIMTSITRACASALLLLISAHGVTAQNITHPNTAPGAPAGSYALSGFESVNLFNGGLNFHLPLLPIGGRGAAGYTMTLPIETRWQMFKGIVNTCPFCEFYQAFYTPSHNNWYLGDKPGYGPGKLLGRGVRWLPDGCNQISYPSAYTVTRLTFVAPDGTEFELRDQLYDGRPLDDGPCTNPQRTSRGRVFKSSDGTAVTFVSDTDILDLGGIFYPSGFLMMRDGNRYRIDAGNVTWIRDRNGNRVVFTYDGQQRVTTITDSLNRQVQIDYYNPPSMNYDRIRYNGFGGAQREIQIYYASLSTVLRQDYSANTPIFVPAPDTNAGNPGGTLFDTTVVSQVKLPNNQSYFFKYNPHAELAQVTLPTGGGYQYDWGPGPDMPAGTDGFDGEWGVPPGWPDPFNPDYTGEMWVYRRVNERRVYSDGGSLASITRYSAAHDYLAQLSNITVDHLDVGQNLLGREKHYFNGLSVGPSSPRSTTYAHWLVGREYQMEVYSDSGSLLRRVVHTWQQRAPVSWIPTWLSAEPANDPRIIETVTTLADANLVSKQTFGYDQYNNQTDIYAYNFGPGAPGPLIRRMHTDYVTFNNGVDYAADTNIHIRNLPLQQQVFDAGGTKRAETFYEYDYYNSDAFHAPLGDCPNISGHDGAFWAGYLMRGNITKTSRALLDNNGGATGWINNYSQYDIAGNVVKEIDPNGNPTQFDLRDNYGSPDNPAVQSSENPANIAPGELGGQVSYAFPFKIINALGHKAYVKYDYYLGRPALREDQNGVRSNTYFNDALDRPTRGVRAIGTSAASQTVFVYNDSDTPVNGYPAHSITTISDKDVFGESNSGNGLKSVTLHDGLGRTRRSAVYEGSTWAITDTGFDTFGRVSQVSNPYRAADPGSASPPAGLWTKTDYDPLGRVTKLTTPDNAHVDTVYSGDQTTVTDQAGKRRRSRTDVLGRLVEVIEDPGGLNHVTSYLYDVLDNLRKVTQGSQKRWLAYDSVSRLIRAKNPEQAANSNLSYTDPVTNDGNGWSMAYSYDAKGNLFSKTDARNITTTYGYDQLNRNTTVSYSDSTPGVTRTFDTAMLGKGRLQKTETAGSMGSRVTINEYDALGRPKSQSQQFFYLGAWGTSYTTRQTYNLAENVKTLTYPSDHPANYTHDQAGRLSVFSGNLGGSPSTYADMIGYNAAGQMIKERFGTNTLLYNNLHYNNRQQLVAIRLGDSATDAGNWSRGAFDFLYGTTAVASGNLFANDTDNNGNLRRQLNYVPLAGGGNVIPQQHDYTYDALNRIATIREQQRNVTGQWSESVSQAYKYDQWGNRTIDLNGGGGGDQETVWVDDALPAGAVPAASGGDSWNWVSSSPAPKSGSLSHISNIADWSDWSPPPFSGNVSHQSGIVAGVHQQYFWGASPRFPVRYGGKLYAHVFLDPLNPPQEVMLQWGEDTQGWEHRAYWGANLLGWGTDGTNSRRYMGPLPAAGGWVRLEVPASAVGLEGKEIHAMAFTLYGGRANWDLAGVEGWTTVPDHMECSWNGWDYDCYWVYRDEYENYVIMDDSIPAGATPGADGGDGWNWRGANNVELVHQHYFYNASDTLQVGAGDKLFTWVYLDSAKPPSEAMLQWNVNGSWEYRAYWGANNIGWGVDGTTSRRYMGPLPATGGWVKLEIPASAVGLEGKIVNGMAFTLYGGRAAWDKTGKISTIPPVVLGPPINNKVYTVDPATNRLTSVNGAPMSLSYDAAGNQTNDGNGERIYDGENRLVEARNSAGVVVSRYVYDPEGRRVRRIIGGQETWQVYGIGGELLSEYAAGAASNSPQKEYGYQNGQLLVVWDGSEIGDRQLQWLVQDHLGSTRMVVDRSGSLGGVRRRDFAPFGEELPAGVGIRNAGIGYIIDSVRQKFDGYERDPETEWDFAQARYYSSVQGRFTSVDQGPFIPADPQSWNRYSFVQNNPLKFIDPTGETLILEGSYAEYILGELEELTGYKLKRDPSSGKVTIDENSPRNTKGTSKELAALLKDIVNPKRSDVKIKTVSDEENVMIDQFATRKLDVADYKVAKTASPGYAASLLGHVLAEYSMAEWVQGPPTSNTWLYNTSHQSGLEYDRRVISDFTGKTEQMRTDSIIQEDSNSMTLRIKYTSVTYDLTIKTLNSSSLYKTKITNVVEHKVK